MFTMEELAGVMGVSFRYVKALKNAGAPFCMGRTRPEWVVRWIDNDEVRAKLNQIKLV